MTSFPRTVKNSLLHILDEMAADPSPFVKSPGSDFSRNRKIGFSDTLNFIISMGGSSINQELLDYFLYNSMETPSASAFVQQRSKILPKAFQHIFYTFNQAFQAPPALGGFRLLAVDGSDIDFFCDARDKENHIDNSSQKGYNAMHLTVLYDLHDRTYADAFLQNGCQKDEFSAFCTMVDRFPSSLAHRTIFFADRGFASYNVFAHILEKGAFFLIRAKDVDSNGIASRMSLPLSGEFDETRSFTLVRRQTKQFKALPGAKLIQKNISFDFLDYGSDETYPMTLRFVRLLLPDGSHECLVTNLPPDSFPSETLLHLYSLRWGVETSFRELKYSVGLVNFHCRKPEFVVQEIWARLILYNFCEVITAHSAASLMQEQDPGRKKHAYQVNFTMAIHICHYFLRLPAYGWQPDVDELIRHYLLPVRPDRHFPRYTKYCHAVSFLYRVR